MSVETILRLAQALLGSTGFSIAGLCAAHACLDDQALLAAREAIGSSLQMLGSIYAVLIGFVVVVVWQQFNDARGFVRSDRVADLRPTATQRSCRSAVLLVARRPSSKKRVSGPRSGRQRAARG